MVTRTAQKLTTLHCQQGSGDRQARPPRQQQRLVNSAAVADNATGCNVKRHGANRQRGLIPQSRHKVDEALDIREVADQSHRDTDGAGALATTVLHDTQKLLQINVRPCLRKTGTLIVFAQIFCRLAGPRVAETTGAQ